MKKLFFTLSLILFCFVSFAEEYIGPLKLKWGMSISEVEKTLNNRYILEKKSKIKLRYGHEFFNHKYRGEKFSGLQIQSITMRYCHGPEWILCGVSVSYSKYFGDRQGDLNFPRLENAMKKKFGAPDSQAEPSQYNEFPEAKWNFDNNARISISSRGKNVFWSFSGPSYIKIWEPELFAVEEDL